MITNNTPRIKYILFSLIILGFLSCQKERSTLKTPEQCGKHAFSLLKQFDKESPESIRKYFIPIELIHEMGNDRKAIVNKKRRQRFASMTQEKYNSFFIGDIYKHITLAQEIFQINWKDIEYTDFLYKEEKYAGLDAIKGDLIISYNNKRFDLYMMYVKYKKVWHLLYITSLCETEIHFNEQGLKTGQSSACPQL